MGKCLGILRAGARDNCHRLAADRAIQAGGPKGATAQARFCPAKGPIHITSREVGDEQASTRALAGWRESLSWILANGGPGVRVGAPLVPVWLPGITTLLVLASSFLRRGHWLNLVVGRSG